MSDQTQTGRDWLSQGWRDYERFVGRHVRSMTVLAGGVFLITVAMIALVSVLARRFVYLAQDTRALVAIFPDLPGWGDVAHSALWRFHQAEIFWGLLSYVVPAAILGVGLGLLNLRLHRITARMSRRLLPSRRHQAGGLALACQRFRLLHSDFWRFTLLLLTVAGVFVLLAIGRSPEFTLERLARLWPVPLAVAIIIGWMVRIAIARNNLLLRRLDLRDAAVARYHRVRLVADATVLLTLAGVILLLLATMPRLATESQERIRSATAVAKLQMDTYLDRELGHPIPDPQAVTQYHRRTAWMERRLARETPSAEAMLDDAGWGVYVGAVLLLQGVLVAWAWGIPRGMEGRWAYATRQALSWLMSLGAGGLVAVFWWGLGFWSPAQVAIFLGACVAGMLALLLARAAMGRAGRRDDCPHCQRIFPADRTVCPFCGVRLPVARRKRQAEFGMLTGSRIVHHRSCRSFSSASGRGWMTFGSLPGALQEEGEDSPLLLRPCKLCLGVSSRWHGDAAWRSARHWADWLAGQLRRRPQPPRGPELQAPSGPADATDGGEAASPEV